MGWIDDQEQVKKAHTRIKAIDNTRIFPGAGFHPFGGTTYYELPTALKGGPNNDIPAAPSHQSVTWVQSSENSNIDSSYSAGNGGYTGGAPLKEYYYFNSHLYIPDPPQVSALIETPGVQEAVGAPDSESVRIIDGTAKNADVVRCHLGKIWAHDKFEGLTFAGDKFSWLTDYIQKKLNVSPETVHPVGAGELVVPEARQPLYYTFTTDFKEIAQGKKVPGGEYTFPIEPDYPQWHPETLLFNNYGKDADGNLCTKERIFIEAGPTEPLVGPVDQASPFGGRSEKYPFLLEKIRNNVLKDCQDPHSRFKLDHCTKIKIPEFQLITETYSPGPGGFETDNDYRSNNGAVSVQSEYNFYVPGYEEAAAGTLDAPGIPQNGIREPALPSLLITTLYNNYSPEWINNERQPYIEWWRFLNVNRNLKGYTDQTTGDPLLLNAFNQNYFAAWTNTVSQQNDGGGTPLGKSGTATMVQLLNRMGHFYNDLIILPHRWSPKLYTKYLAHKEDPIKSFPMAINLEYYANGAGGLAHYFAKHSLDFALMRTIRDASRNTIGGTNNPLIMNQSWTGVGDPSIEESFWIHYNKGRSTFQNARYQGQWPKDMWDGDPADGLSMVTDGPQIQLPDVIYGAAHYSYNGDLWERKRYRTFELTKKAYWGEETSSPPTPPDAAYGNWVDYFRIDKDIFNEGKPLTPVICPFSEAGREDPVNDVLEFGYFPEGQNAPLVNAALEGFKQDLNSKFLSKRTRTYSQILHGHLAYSETLLWRIEKWVADENGEPVQKVQDFWYPNLHPDEKFSNVYDETDDSREDSPQVIKLTDTQVKYNTPYVYVIYAWQAIFGTEYEYYPHLKVFAELEKKINFQTEKTGIKGKGEIEVVGESFAMYCYKYSNSFGEFSPAATLSEKRSYKSIIVEEGIYGENGSPLYVSDGGATIWGNQPDLNMGFTRVPPSAGIDVDGNTVDNNQWSPACPDGSPPVPPGVGALTNENEIKDFNTDYPLENDPCTDHVGLMLDIVSRPSLKVVEVPVYKQAIPARAMNKPPVKPNAKTTPYAGVNNKYLVSLNNGTGWSKEKPIPIKDEDKQHINEYLESQGSEPGSSVYFEYDDPPAHFEIFRIDYAPETYEDFANGEHLSIPTGGKVTSVHFQPVVEPNKKYYYTFRTVDFHGHFSNPTTVYEIELVDDSGAVYLVTELYKFPSPKLKLEKSMRRFLQITPALSQTAISNAEELNTALSSETPNLGNNDITTGYSTFEQWQEGGDVRYAPPTKFKIRLISKKSGRAIDLNVGVATRKKTTNEDKGKKYPEGF